MADEKKPTLEGLSHDQRRALLFDNINKIRPLRERKNQVMNDLRSAYAVAKSDGFAKEDIDYVFKLLDKEEKEMVGKRKRHNELASYVRHAIWTQPDLFDVPEPKDKAYEEGKAAALEGKGSEIPQIFLGGEVEQRYADGYAEGLAAKNVALARAFMGNQEPAPTPAPSVPSAAAVAKGGTDPHANDTDGLFRSEDDQDEADDSTEAGEAAPSMTEYPPKGGDSGTVVPFGKTLAEANKAGDNMAAGKNADGTPKTAQK